MALFEDDNVPGIPEDYSVRRIGPAKGVPNGFFRILKLTPRSIDLLNAVIDRSADFDRALAETHKEPADCDVNSKKALEAYSDLVQSKGQMVEYIASLMDKINDPNLNQRRTTVVRYD